jgi:hypothetical protein
MRSTLFPCLAVLLCLGAATPAQAATKKTTSIFVNTVPVGASVFLVGETETKLGVTPIATVRVPRGEITLKMVLEGYQDDIEKVSIGWQRQGFNFKLVKLVVPGELTFTGDANAAGASVTVDGTPQGQVPTTFKAAPGRHQVIIAKEGFVESTRWVDVAEGQKASFDVVLTRKESPKGTLIVTSAPLGAEVKVDGQIRGVTPAVLEGLTAGEHTVEWALTDHLPAQKRVSVEGGKSTTVDARLEPMVVAKIAPPPPPVASGGDLKVLTDLDGVQIYLDGDLLGTAPVTKVGVQPGNHLVEGRIPNVPPVRKDVEIKAGQVNTVSLDLKVSADKVLGEIHVVSPAPNSSVSIDGSEKLALPLTRSLQAGAHLLEVTAPSTAPWKTSVQVAAGGRLEVMAQPIPTGKVTIALPADHKSAEVLVDTKAAGVAPLTLELPEGTHTIVVRDADGALDTRTVVVGAGQQQTIDTHLAIPEVPRAVFARRSMPFSGAAFRPGDGSVDVGAGWPELFQVRMGAGIVDHFDAGVAIRSQLTLLDFELHGKYTVLDSQSFALAAEVGAGFAFGYSRRNAFNGRVTGLASLFPGQNAALTLGVTLQGFSDRLASPNDLERSTGVQTILSLIAEFKLTDHLNLYLRFDGDPITSGRPIWNDSSIHGNTALGGAAGFSYLF